MRRGSKAAELLRLSSRIQVQAIETFPLGLALICVMMMTGLVKLVTGHELQSDSPSAVVSMSVSKFVFTLNPTDEPVISCWNMRGFSSGQFYLHSILNQFDIFSVSEHWLFEDVLIVDMWGMARLPKTIPILCQAKEVRGVLECFGMLAWVILYPSCQSIVTGSLGLSLC